MTDQPQSDARPEPSGEVGDQNVQKLLADAYRAEPPDETFVLRSTAAMHAEAVSRRAMQNSPTHPVRGAHRMIGWTAACAIVAVLLGGGIWWFSLNPDQPEIQASRPEPSETSDPVPEVVRTFQPHGMIARPSPEPQTPETLAVGESLETSERRRRMALPDGSIVYINRDTTVRLTASRQLTVDRGEVYVEVSPRYEAKALFEVITPDHQVTALGTKFNVRIQETGTEVAVTQGKVKIDGVETPIESGQQFASNTVEPIPLYRASDTIAWTRDLMASVRSPLIPRSDYQGGALTIVDPNGQESRLSLRKFHIDVHIEDGFARTSIDQTYFNHEYRRLEGTFRFPLPPDASLSRLAMYVGGRLMEGGMAERGHARNVFDSIVRTQKDPALLEWVDGSTFKMRVFPLDGRQEKRIILSYTQRLDASAGRCVYRFPAGHSMQQVGDWSSRIRVRNGAKSKWQSESHSFEASSEESDLILESSAKQVRPDRDVVLTLRDDEDIPSSEPQFVTATHEGAKYLMLRWRPKLPRKKPAESNEPRDWIFLFETSADRDPLLARVQIDIVRTILENAERHDTFQIVTAGASVRRMSEKPLKVSPENLDRAVESLESAHLIGGLDLERALRGIGPLAKGANNPYLVHLGSGLPVLGERNVDALIERIPESIVYLGVGVGKRWSRTLMRAAASRTGGYSTSINPDEQVVWRTRELLDAIRAPRLLSIEVSEPGGSRPFLLFAPSIVEGESLCAIRRLDENEPLPKKIEVTGRLAGRPFQKRLKIESVATGADYLPRQWAKLEIDRMVVDGADKHRDQLVSLSKSMYVMSPFTSLLVLENDAMYDQYEVERGRKDHWALYPCPEKIPFEIASMNLRVKRQRGVVDTLFQVERSHVPFPDEPPISYPNAEDWEWLSSQRNMRVLSMDLVSRGVLETQLHDVLREPTKLEFIETPLEDVIDFLKDYHDIEIQVDQRALDEAGIDIESPITRNIEGVSLRSALRLILREQGLTYVIEDEVLLITAPEEAETRLPAKVYPVHDFVMPIRPPNGTPFGPGSIPFDFSRVQQPFSTSPARPEPSRAMDVKALLDRLQPSKQTVPRRYRRRSFGYRLRLFEDLTDFTPGLNTLTADLRHAADSSRPPTPEPRIDTDAKRLIERARSTSWQTADVLDARGKPCGTVDFNGAGLYRSRRSMTFGLEEETVFDGRHLWHLYAELGLASRREPSRFHRADLATLVPWFVPSVDDLACHADVISVDARTVALVPRLEPKTEWLEVHLIFDSGRLTAKRLVEKPSGAVRRSETYTADGTVRWLDTDEKVVAERRYRVRPTTAPRLKPDTDGLVVLPFPLKYVNDSMVFGGTGGMGGGTIEPKVNALESIAPGSNLSSQDASRRIVDRFFRHGDRRLGLYLLWMAHGFSPEVTDGRFLVTIDGKEHQFNPAVDHPNSPAAKYVAAMLKVRRANGRRLIGPIGGRDDGFLQQFARFHDRVVSWRFRKELPTRDVGLEDELRETLAWIRQTRSGPLGWALMSVILERLPELFDKEIVGERAIAPTERPRILRQVAECLEVFVDDPRLEFAARYERARLLAEAGDRATARKSIEKLLLDWLERGSWVSVDKGLRTRFYGEKSDREAWLDLLRALTERLIAAEMRPSVVQLAEKLHAMDEPLVAEELFASTVRDVPKDDLRTVTLCAVAYLWETGQQARADETLGPLLMEPSDEDFVPLWRLAERLASARGDSARALDCLERAIQRRFEQLPETVNLEEIRFEYRQLLDRYDALAKSTTALAPEASDGLIGRVVSAADRWRSLETDPTDACRRAAKILAELGAFELAWDYTTTPSAVLPESDVNWRDWGKSLRGRGCYVLADRAYATAFAQEPKNARILWDWAEMHVEAGRHNDARAIYRRLAEGTWASKFDEIQLRSKELIHRP